MRIYDTLTRGKREFEPIKAGKIGLYVCGMTVYDYCHLGHARVLVSFDTITRFLRARGWDVTYVRNITDIDDKILARAAENGEDYRDLTARFIDAMHEDEEQLAVLRPDKEPRATAYIEQMLNITQRLVDKGFAYQAGNGDVYYSVSKFVNYGKLSGKKLDELEVGARVEVDIAKRDPRDFVLWKASDHAEASWASNFGDGRPGWHIECSAMATDTLGNNFDIHGGGPDLPFPHHENEIAQSEAATGEDYANYWMHAGAIRVDGVKMSKSLGNFFTIREILEKYPAEQVRYMLVNKHYRSHINYSEETLVNARQGLERFYTALRAYDVVDAKPLSELDQDNRFVKRFIDAMEDDFNTPEALAAMFDLARELNTRNEQGLAVILKSLGSVLGILQGSAEAFLQSSSDASSLSAQAVEQLIAERLQAKLDKDYARADQIRTDLLDQGIVLEDSREGTNWRRES